MPPVPAGLISPLVPAPRAARPIGGLRGGEREARRALFAILAANLADKRTLVGGNFSEGFEREQRCLLGGASLGCKPVPQ